MMPQHKYCNLAGCVLCDKLEKDGKERSCQYCGRVFYNRGDNLVKWQKRKYCSRSCAQAFMEGKNGKRFPIGTESLCRYSRGKELFVKVSEFTKCRHNWKRKAHLVIESARGRPVDSSIEKVVYLDGNRLNCTIDNIAIVSIGDDFLKRCVKCGKGKKWPGKSRGKRQCRTCYLESTTSRWDVVCPGCGRTRKIIHSVVSRMKSRFCRNCFVKTRKRGIEE